VQRLVEEELEVDIRFRWNKFPEEGLHNGEERGTRRVRNWEKKQHERAYTEVKKDAKAIRRECMLESGYEL
jgi:hypothetical protein